MNTIAWAIIALSINYNTVTYPNDVRFATASGCEQALAFLKKKQSQAFEYICVPVIVPAAIVIKQ